MFTNDFNLKTMPFEEYIQPEQLIDDERFTQGLARLDYFALHGIAAVMSGPTGVGKSCLLEHFLDRLPAHRYNTLCFQFNRLNSGALLRMIVSAMGEKPSLGKDRLFRQILDKSAESERSLLLAFDEAHLLNAETLTDLRLLIRPPSRSHPGIKLLLCGQETLSNLLARASLADLANRICVRFHLRPFNADQTNSYLEKRLCAAGGSSQLFEPAAMRLIHEYSNGVPRAINNLATACLIHAAVKQLNPVTESIIAEAASELRLL